MKFRRWQSVGLLASLFIATLSLVLGLATSTPAQTKPQDIQGHWAQSCITSLLQQRVLTGYPDGTFRPNTAVTRAEFSTLVRRAFPLLGQVRNPATFQDVPTNHWAFLGIQYTYQTGFMSGYPDSLFKPSEPVSRVQALGAMAGGLRYATTQPTADTLSKALVDADQIPAYARGAIAAAIENGLVVNYPNVKQLNPNQTATRADIASFFCRALPASKALVPNQYLASTGTVPTDNSIQPPFPPPAPKPLTHEIRGVWLTNIDSDALFDRTVLRSTVQDLARFNFNTIYPTIWNWGYTQYPSKVAQNTLGYAIDPRPAGYQGRDPLAELVDLGRQNRIAIIPWFEFGFMAPADSELALRHPDWLTQRQDGSRIWQDGEYQRVWLNPFHPEAEQFLLDLVLEVVTRYNVDGIQFDDHLGVPFDFGYDPYTVQLYQLEHNGQLPPSNPKDPEWTRWRADKITGFMGRVFREIKQRKPSLLVALSPNPQKFSYEYYLQDWSQWQRLGYVEELLVQIYRRDLPSFLSELSQPELLEAKQRIPVGIGILSGLKGSTTPMSLVQQQIQAVRDRGFVGVSFFFYETLWNLVNEPPDQRRSALRTSFLPALPRPNLKQGWVP